MRWLITLMVFTSVIALPMTANAQPTTVWSKAFGDIGEDRGIWVEQTSDGNFIAAGYTGSKGSGALDVWLVKLDINGEILWDKTFGGSFDDKARSVTQTKDGGFIIAGYTVTDYNSWDA